MGGSDNYTATSDGSDDDDYDDHAVMKFMYHIHDSGSDSETALRVCRFFSCFFFFSTRVDAYIYPPPSTCWCRVSTSCACSCACLPCQLCDLHPAIRQEGRVLEENNYNEGSGLNASVVSFMSWVNGVTEKWGNI